MRTFYSTPCRTCGAPLDGKFLYKESRYFCDEACWENRAFVMHGPIRDGMFTFVKCVLAPSPEETAPAREIHDKKPWWLMRPLFDFQPAT